MNNSQEHDEDVSNDHPSCNLDAHLTTAYHKNNPLFPCWTIKTFIRITFDEFDFELYDSGLGSLSPRPFPEAINPGVSR